MADPPPVTGSSVAPAQVIRERIEGAKDIAGVIRAASNGAAMSERKVIECSEAALTSWWREITDTADVALAALAVLEAEREVSEPVESPRGAERPLGEGTPHPTTGSLTSPAEECPSCGGDAGNNWFDRSICACDRMHTRCRDCGFALDGCEYEPQRPAVSSVANNTGQAERGDDRSAVASSDIETIRAALVRGRDGVRRITGVPGDWRWSSESDAFDALDRLAAAEASLVAHREALDWLVARGEGMRRGQRKLWREVAANAAKVAESTNYTEEYIYGVEFTNSMQALLRTTPEASPAQASNDPASGGGV